MRRETPAMGTSVFDISGNRPADASRDGPLGDRKDAEREIGSQALAQALAALQAPAGAIYLLDQRRDRLSLVAHRGIAPAYAQQHETMPLSEGLLGQTTRRGEPRILIGEEIPAPFHQMLAEASPRAVLLLPLALQAEPLGVLIAASPEADRLAGLAQDVLKAVAGQAALALYSLQLMRQAHRRAQELELILDVGRSLAASLAIEDALAKLARELVERLPVTACRVLLLDESNEALITRMVYARAPIGWPSNLWEPLPLAEAPVHRLALQTSRPVILRESGPLREEVAPSPWSRRRWPPSCSRRRGPAR